MSLVRRFVTLTLLPYIDKKKRKLNRLMLFDPFVCFNVFSVNLKKIKEILKSHAHRIHVAYLRMSDYRAVGL